MNQLGKSSHPLMTLLNEFFLINLPIYNIYYIFFILRLTYLHQLRFKRLAGGLSGITFVEIALIRGLEWDARRLWNLLY